MVLDQAVIVNGRGAQIPIDVLVLTRNTWKLAKELAASLKIRKLVFDSSVPAYRAEAIRAVCDAVNLPVHLVAADGAFMLSNDKPAR